MIIISHYHSESANAMKQNPVQNALGLLPHYNWQATKMTVKERLAFLFNNNILSDVTFVVGRDVQQQRIPAHRFVLSVGSAVFDAMFNRHSCKTGSSAIGIQQHMILDIRFILI